MDRGGWQAIVRGVARVGHDCVTEHTLSWNTVFPCSLYESKVNAFSLRGDFGSGLYQVKR